MDAPMPPSSSSSNPPPPPPPTTVFMHSQSQTETARTTKVLKRPSEEQASSSGPRGPGPGPAPGGAAAPHPLGGNTDLYLQQAHLAASSQHMSAGLINLQQRQTFLEEVQANNLSAGQPIFQTAFVQQNTFLSLDSRQNNIFIGPPASGEPEATVYSTGGQPPHHQEHQEQEQRRHQ